MRVAKKPEIKYLNAIGEKMRYCRKSAGLNQTEVSELMGVHRSSVSYYETGKIQAPVVYLHNYSKQFQVLLDDLADNLITIEKFSKKYPLSHFFGKIIVGADIIRP